MKLDIRLPIGLLFSICGVLLVLFGAMSNRQLYERSLNININLWWGLAMLVFGIVMLTLGWSHKHAGPRLDERTPRATNPH